MRYVILCGGLTAEREVSLASGETLFRALASQVKEVAKVILDAEALPAGLDPSRDVIIPALHGGYGEGGGLQSDLEKAGFAYAGSDPEASARALDKVATKAIAQEKGIPVLPEYAFQKRDTRPPPAREIISRTGPSVVLKPRSEGSSVGLHFTEGDEELSHILPQLPAGEWMAERRLRGRELTVGLIDGKALPVVEIIPTGGVYDYTRKYTPGSTNYQCPAALPEALTEQLQMQAEAIYHAVGVRDFARADFLLDPQTGEAFFLEINTLPGLTETSLLPKAAKATGLAFESLAMRLTAPAVERFQHLTSTATLS